MTGDMDDYGEADMLALLEASYPSQLPDEPEDYLDDGDGGIILGVRAGTEPMLGLWVWLTSQQPVEG